MICSVITVDTDSYTNVAWRFATVCSYGQRYSKNKYSSVAWSSVGETISPQILRGVGQKEDRRISCVGVCVSGCVGLGGMEDLSGESVLWWLVNAEWSSQDQREERMYLYLFMYLYVFLMLWGHQSVCRETLLRFNYIQFQETQIVDSRSVSFRVPANECKWVQ